MKPDRVVVVLSGGGMKTMAHIGVLRAMEEADMRPAEIVATSAGALVGALVAGGMPYDRTVELVTGMRREDLFALRRGSLLIRGVGAESLLDPDPLMSFLERHLPVRDFGSLDLPLRVVTADLDHGTLEVFGAGGRSDLTVPQAVYASMALPPYLPPLRDAGGALADGGLLSVLPLDAAAACEADVVVASDVGPVREGHPQWAKLAPALLAPADRALSLAMADQKERMVEAWLADSSRPQLILVRPEVDPYGTFSFERTVEFIQAGYRAGHAALARSRSARAGS